MKSFKLFAFIILIFSSLACFAQNKVVHPIKPPNFEGLGQTADIKDLAQGNFSKVETPFVLVARDDKTYAQLQNLVEGLPAATTIDFRKNAVIAGFAGEKSKGGWTVVMKKTDNGRIGVVFKPPGKDMMSAQVISQPYRVVVVPIEESQGVTLNLPPDIINKMQNFQTNKADFEFVGGIAGIKKKFKANGTIRLLTFGDNISIWFDLKGTGAEQKRRLFELGSGTIKNGKIEITRMDAGSFVEFPRPPFKISGTLKSKILSLNFQSVETTFADGFEGKGKIEAVKIGK